MIKFPCKCGHLFNLTEDMAGGLVQCPRCGLLADIPTLSDLPNITEDGIFKIDDPIPLTDEITVADLHEAFTRNTRDSHGREKDLRADEEHYRKIGVAREVDALGYAPKYDPATGELIRPLKVKEDEPVPVQPIEDEAIDGAMPVIPIPISTAPSLAYANNATRQRITPLTVLLELFMPANVIVLFFVFIFYIIAGFLGAILAVYSLYFQLALQVLNIPLWLILAHYGCVIEDIGPDAQDELPRPLRHLTVDDIWNPFIRVVGAGLICYFPVLIAGNPRVHLGNATVPVVFALQLIGSFFFPAVVLTTITGTTIANLRPDRVVGVIRSCGVQYLLSVGVFLIALLPSEFCLLGRSSLPPYIASFVPDGASQPYVLYPLLATSVYLTHYFCWHLGLMYRAHHHQFPWLLQRHISTRRDPVLAPPRRKRRRTSL